jgi:hypothetical protein
MSEPGVVRKPRTGVAPAVSFARRTRLSKEGRRKGGPRLAAPEEPPTTPVLALRPFSEPDTIVLVIGGPVARPGLAALCERVRVLLESCDAGVVVIDVGTLVDPDAVVVDALARLQLTAQRLGRGVHLRHACGELEDLLAAMGLDDVFSRCAELPLEPRWKTEEWKQARGVEKEADPGYPAG